MGLQQLNLAPFLAAQQSLGQANARLAAIAEAKRAKRKGQTLGTVGAIAGLVLSGGNPSAASAGYGLGASLAGGNTAGVVQSGASLAGGIQAQDQQTQNSAAIQQFQSQMAGSPGINPRAEGVMPLPGTGPVAPDPRGAFSSLLGHSQLQGPALQRLGGFVRDESAAALAREKAIQIESGKDRRLNVQKRGQDINERNILAQINSREGISRESRKIRQSLFKSGHKNKKELLNIEQKFKAKLQADRLNIGRDLKKDEIEARAEQSKDEAKLRRELAKLKISSKTESPGKMLARLLDKDIKAASGGPKLTRAEAEAVGVLSRYDAREGRRQERYGGFKPSGGVARGAPNPATKAIAGTSRARPAKPTTAADFNKLPKGTFFIDPNDPEKLVRIKQ